MRRQAQREWFAIARTPTWLGRLLIAFALAAVFALLGQWQLGRALPANTNKQVAQKPQLSAFEISPDASNFAIIAGRLQSDGASGYWLVTNSQVLKSADASQVGLDLTIAWGWADSVEAAMAAESKINVQTFAAQKIEVKGVLAESEAPALSHTDNARLFDSLSLAQLVNLYQPLVERKTVSQFLILQSKPELFASSGLQPIKLATAKPSALETINWLSAFYALEWSVFAGFAVFMWWRLVEDERLRRRAES